MRGLVTLPVPSPLDLVTTPDSDWRPEISWPAKHKQSPCPRAPPTLLPDRELSLVLLVVLICGASCVPGGDKASRSAIACRMRNAKTVIRQRRGR